jgi:hypothetical protein
MADPPPLVAWFFKNYTRTSEVSTVGLMVSLVNVGGKVELVLCGDRVSSDFSSVSLKAVSVGVDVMLTVGTAVVVKSEAVGKEVGCKDKDASDGGVDVTEGKVVVEFVVSVGGGDICTSGDAKIGTPHTKSPDSPCWVKKDIGRSGSKSKKFSSKQQLDVADSKTSLNNAVLIA